VVEWVSDSLVPVAVTL
jgi:hypothetical protein